MSLRFCDAANMRRPFQKFIAVLMLLWLPLSGGSALAAAINMQAQHSDCHEMVMQDMQHDTAAQCHSSMPSHDSHGTCSSCGLCHLACSACMDAPPAASLTLQSPAQEHTPYLVSFSSTTTAPLLPPPLARV